MLVTTPVDPMALVLGAASGLRVMATVLQHRVTTDITLVVVRVMIVRTPGIMKRRQTMKVAL